MNDELPQAQAVLSQRIDESYVLTLFKDRRSKVCEIPLGTDEKAARQQAEAIISTVKNVHGIDDKTHG